MIWSSTEVLDKPRGTFVGVPLYEQGDDRVSHLGETVIDITGNVVDGDTVGLLFSMIHEREEAGLPLDAIVLRPGGVMALQRVCEALPVVQA